MATTTMKKAIRYIDDTHAQVTKAYGWLLGFGDNAKLIYPDDLIEKFQAYLDKIRMLYQNGRK